MNMVNINKTLNLICQSVAETVSLLCKKTTLSVFLFSEKAPFFGGFFCYAYSYSYYYFYEYFYNKKILPKRETDYLLFAT